MIDTVNCPYYLVSRVTLVVTSALKKGLAAAGVGDVKPAYLGALFALWKEDGLKVVELGRRSGLEASTMTGLIDRMEHDGLVERRDDATDRRVQRINLTEKGREALLSYRSLPPKYTRSDPRPPMKLMMPLAWLRYLEGVMSGIRAMTGERNRAMDRFMRMIVTIMSERISLAMEKGMRMKKTAARIDPARM